MRFSSLDNNGLLPTIMSWKRVEITNSGKICK
jgi:hypothetical protein